MEDLSLHILDVAENSLRAKARNIRIRIREEMKKDSLKIEIADDGRGMPRKEACLALDPFFTTKGSKKTGMGLSLFAQSAREAQGNVRIDSRKGKGTRVTASFRHSHIDRRPLGNMAATLITLIAANPEVDFTFEHKRNGDGIRVDTKKIKKGLKSSRIDSPKVLRVIREGLEEFYKVSY